MANSLWVTAVSAGKLADRPTTVEVPPDTFAFYYATDSDAQKLTMWDDTASAWKDVSAVLGTVTALAAASVKLTAVTFANLPASPTEGEVAYITDCATHTIGGTAAGSGTTKCLVIYDGTNWIIGGVPTQV